MYGSRERRSKLTDSLLLISFIVRLVSTAYTSAGPPLLDISERIGSLVIHGEHHSATTSSPQVNCFRQLIERLRSTAKASSAKLDAEILEIVSEDEGTRTFGNDWRFSTQNYEDISGTIISLEEESGRQIYSTSSREYELFFTRRIRSVSSKQMIVLVDSVQQLSRIINDGHGRFIQAEPAFWNSFARVFIVFKDPPGFLDSPSTTVDELAHNLTVNMKVYNAVLMAPSNNSRSECAARRLCLHCYPPMATGTKSLAIRQITSNAEETDFRGNLNGFKLVSAATNTYRTFYNTGKLDDEGHPIYAGVDHDLLQVIASKMNFTVQWNREEPDTTWGIKLPNGTWNGIIGRVAYGELDISISTVSMLQDRHQIVDFSMPYAFDGSHILEAAPIPLAPGIKALSNPFTSDTWLACGVVAVFVSVTLYASLKVGGLVNAETAAWIRRNELVSSVILEVINSALRAYPEKSMDSSVKMHSTRMILATWSLLAMILTTYYLTIQFSLFVDVPFTEACDTNEDTYRMPKIIVTLKSSSSEILYKKWGMGDRIIPVTPLQMAQIYFNKSMEDRRLGLTVFRNVVRNFLFNDPAITTKTLNPRNFRLSRGYPMPLYSAAVLQKRSPYTGTVSKVIIRLQETGIVDHLNTYYEIVAGLYEARFSEMSYDPRKKAAKERPLVKLSIAGHLIGAFWLLLLGLAPAFLVFLWEVRIGRRVGAEAEAKVEAAAHHGSKSPANESGGSQKPTMEE